MHAMIVEVSIDPSRGDEAQQMLETMVVPLVTQLPGFVSGIWLRSEDGTSGSSVVVFQDEQSARAGLERAQQQPPDAPVTLTRGEVREVAAQA